MRFQNSKFVDDEKQDSKCQNSARFQISASVKTKIPGFQISDRFQISANDKTRFQIQ